MPSGAVRRARAPLIALLGVCATVTGCSGAGVFGREYEYEEELYLSLDGSATLNVNASVASLVALRGADLDPDPRARVDRNRVRALFEGEGTRASVSLARRDGRRFVHASIRVDDVRELSRLAPFAWSVYRFERRDGMFEFRQVVGPSAGGTDPAIQWTGEETVLFRMHLPSEILFHNASSREVKRGNILEWEQPLAERLTGRPVKELWHRLRGLDRETLQASLGDVLDRFEIDGLMEHIDAFQAHIDAHIARRGEAEVITSPPR